MIQKINAPVSVNLSYDSLNKKVSINEVIWNNKIYPIVKLGLHHFFRRGRTLYHVFSVASENLFFRLILNSETLHWNLEQIADEY